MARSRRPSPHTSSAPAARGRMSTKQLIEESRRWLGIINAHKLNEYKKRKVVSDTLENFRSYYNKGYLEYRKSVTEGGEFAAIEWSGRGSVFEDVIGRRFIDCLGGYGIYSAGINHPKIVRAVKSQLERMPLSSQELLDPLRGALAELLGELAPGDLQNCFFISNGTDAVEGAMKLARLYTGKAGFISSVSGFHGKSYGSLSLMGKAEYRLPFEPMLQDVYFVPFGAAAAIDAELGKAAAVGQEIAAVILEPVQGEAGAIVPDDDYWPAVREICTRHGVLLIADEVQTGMGRTGKMFAVDHWDVAPDILCLGKALGGGVMPLSAFLSTPAIWKKLEENPFIHSSTFGGNPLACAAGIAAVNVTLEEDLPGQAAATGAYFLDELRGLQGRYSDHLREVRGLGLLIGMEFVDTEFGYAVAAGLFKRGVLVAGTLLSARTLRIEPALAIPRVLVDEVLEKLDDTLRELTA
ncbi:MAG: aminotransferase class III-fold pyridoxal phosphate-dependent enzyme [Vicinamibacteria bacterium]|nr:aminotransferase class III-fold pyridoxal phosphate-dependent enzyme [Vicinamibacteria bacterium]